MAYHTVKRVKHFDSRTVALHVLVPVVSVLVAERFVRFGFGDAYISIWKPLD